MTGKQSWIHMDSLYQRWKLIWRVMYSQIATPIGLDQGYLTLAISRSRVRADSRCTLMSAPLCPMPYMTLVDIDSLAKKTFKFRILRKVYFFHVRSRWGFQLFPMTALVEPQCQVVEACRTLIRWWPNHVRSGACAEGRIHFYFTPAFSKTWKFQDFPWKCWLCFRFFFKLVLGNSWNFQVFYLGHRVTKNYLGISKKNSENKRYGRAVDHDLFLRRQCQCRSHAKMNYRF